MVENVSRRELLGYTAAAAGGIGTASLLGSSNAGSGKPSGNESNETVGERTCAGTTGEPGTGKVDTHVIGEGSHRGENNFTYFLDRSSLGLDAEQPDEVYSRIYVKLDEDWAQPTVNDTCKVYWAGCNLSAGAAGQGGTRPSGDDGWSVRIYTRGPVTDGRVSVGTYVYHLDQPDRFGSLWRWPDRAAIGTWNQIDTYVKLNSVTDGAANYDGVVRTWLNGTLQNARSDLRWRTTAELGFDRLGPGSYWGGSKESPQDNILYYDLFQYAVGSDGLGG
ncbi:hypothetical protein G9464_03540 [Halostella sp. JP-L12]|uniref:hypothetical protein n=1 Tax=Halostella TaxID=1843185 RepID=UPI000EF7C1CC|nr:MULTISPECIES: hypothetical protein [Halostella]NHN46668.1 hypothetical protein [Halostella sp. JP-L12]